MSSKIIKLPESLINQIAAGEVIERPASVVKELVENAIDAESTFIEIELEEAGRQKIKVLDNGCGMSLEELKLSLERHATSKIKNLDDLFTVSTLGFRGEALPSIASVSNVKVTSKPKDQLEGYRLSVAGGKKQKEEVCGATDGTEIVVQDLFFNTPARLKFLKAKGTELGHVSETVSLLALSYPEIGFRLQHEDKEIFHFPKTKNHFERVLHVLKASGDDFLSVAQETYPWKLSGYVSLPRVTSATAKHCIFFVNQRPIKDRNLQHAVTFAYQNLIPNRMYPKVVLFLECNEGEVDVNVHPTKKEVRFRDPRFIHSFVSKTVRHVLEQSYVQKHSEHDEINDSHAKMNAYPLQDQMFVHLPHDLNDLSEGRLGERAGMVQSPKGFESELESRAANFPLGNLTACLKTDHSSREARLIAGPEGDFTYLGQVQNSYLVCEKSGEVIFMDQHAAHERILFEKIKKDWQTQKLEKQSLLIPLQLELSQEEMAMLDQIQPELEAFGFELEPFGGQTILVKAVPALLQEKISVKLLQSIVQELMELPKSSFGEQFLDKLLATLACHLARTANEALNPLEAKSLLTQVFQLKTAPHCPHGRPFLHKIPISEIEKKFKR